MRKKQCLYIEACRGCGTWAWWALDLRHHPQVFNRSSLLSGKSTRGGLLMFLQVILPFIHLDDMGCILCKPPCWTLLFACSRSRFQGSAAGSPLWLCAMTCDRIFTNGTIEPFCPGVLADHDWLLKVKALKLWFFRIEVVLRLVTGLYSDRYGRPSLEEPGWGTD